MTPQSIWTWLCDHQLLCWIVLSAVLNLALRARTADQWIEWCDRFPRLASALRLMRAVGVDPAKMLEAGAAVVNGKARVDWFSKLPDTAVVRAVAEQMAAPPTITAAPDRDTEPGSDTTE